MSTHGGSHTVLVDRAFDPLAAATFEELERALEAEAKQAKARVEGLSRVFVMSRGAWVASMTAALLEEHPLPALAFLTLSGEPAFQDDMSHWVTRLEGAPLDRAAGELRDLLHFIGANAELAARVDPIGCIEDGDLEDQLASPLTSEWPGSDERVLNSDEGQGGRLLIVWLKSVLAVLETAHLHGMAVVHAADEPY